MESQAAGDVILVLLASLIALPLILGACLRYPALTTLGLIAMLSVFSSSTWGQLHLRRIHARIQRFQCQPHGVGKWSINKFMMRSAYRRLLCGE